MSNGGVKRREIPSAPRMSRRSTSAIAEVARSGLAAPEITAQLCAMLSIWHSGRVAEPSGVPSSK